MAHTTFDPVQRALLAVLAGGSLIAVITFLTGSTSPDPTSTDAAPSSTSARSAPDDPVFGQAGSGSDGGLSARAEGIAITGADQLTAQPSITATSGRRVATEENVHSRGDLVTAEGVELSAAVVAGNTHAQAIVQHARYGDHELGRLAVSCRNGVPTAERTGTGHLTTNVLVTYGNTGGGRVSGASVVVLGPGERVIRIVRIATASCTNPRHHTTAAPQHSTTSSDPGTHRPNTSPNTASGGRAAGGPSSTPQEPDQDSGARVKRRLVPRAPAPSTHTAHLTVTG